MSRVLVLGAGGMLGHKLCQRMVGHEVAGVVRQPAARYGGFAEIYAGITLIDRTDVLVETQLEAVIRQFAPQVVVNCVGLVKQLHQSRDECLAIATNALLPHRLARLCDASGSRLIHISTDCVFNGSKGAYREDDETDARDLYGRSKALGETTPAETMALTLRTSFVGRELGPSRHGLLEWFLSLDGRLVDGYAGVRFSGVTTIELAELINRLIDEPPELAGVVHVASQPISKFDLLELCRRLYGLDVEIRRSDEPVCDRSLIMGKLSELTGYRPPAWSEMLDELRRDPTPYERWSQREDTMD